jgi:protein CpxP
MMRRNSRRALLMAGICAALVLGLAPVGSSAQTTPQPLQGTPQTDQAPQAPQSDRRSGRLERRLEFLHSELNITPAQQQLWDAFADAVRREAADARNDFRDRRDGFRGPNGRPGRAGIVERLERRQQDLAEQSAHYERLLSALRPLYAALNDDQRRAADENLFSPGRADRGRRGFRRFGMNDGFGRGFYRPFERSYGPFDPPYDSFDRNDRFGRYYR